MYIYQLLTNNGSGVTRESLLAVAAFIVALLFALIFHEVAHGLVALWFGDRTAKSYGRLSLNPAKHFDWMGLLMMLFCGFGWAKPVPVNVSNFKKQKAGMICVSLAGIVTNLLTAFVFAGLWLFAFYAGFGLTVADKGYYAFTFLSYLGEICTTLNIGFALFNVLPLYPLDGYRLLSCFVPQSNAFMTFLRKYSLYIIIGLVLIGNLLPAQFSPLDLYIGTLQEKISTLYLSFWGLFIK